MQCLLECENISKSFPGMKALDEICFSLTHGEIHGLVGENGAGKSTLMKIFSGVFNCDEGKTKDKSSSIYLNSKKVNIKNPKDAIENGIMTIHQEINVVYDLMVYENIFLNNEINRFGLLCRKKMIDITNKLLEEYGVQMKATDRLGNLSVDKQKLVEVVKALSKEAKVLILDEPTSVLTEEEAKHLFTVIKQIAKKGVGIIFISHNLKEVLKYCDRITVLRGGKVTGNLIASETTIDELIEKMVGRKIDMSAYKKESYIGKDTLLKIRNLSYKKLLKDISLELKVGEIIGITGLVGSGGTELAKCVFACEGYKTQSELELRGKKVTLKSPRMAIQNGISYLTEDRKKEGLILPFSIYDNITFPSLKKYSGTLGWLRRKKQIKTSEDMIKMLKIKAKDVHSAVESLSGGNQQKVVLAKWLETDPYILILDEPTIGIDVAAKFEVRNIISNLAKSGKGIILITNEYPELKSLCDKIYVMFKGEFVKEFDNENLNEDDLIKYSLKGKNE